MTAREGRAPYCVAKGCAALPPVEHLREHLRWGCTGPEHEAELLAAHDAVRRAEVLTEAADLLSADWDTARTTGQRADRLRCIHTLRRMADDADPDTRDDVRKDGGR